MRHVFCGGHGVLYFNLLLMVRNVCAHRSLERKLGMPSKLLHLTTCPYCENGAGEIRLDLDRIATLHEFHAKRCPRADQAPDLNPYAFSSDQPGSVFCNHLVSLSCDFYYQDRDERRPRGGRKWELACKWRHPTVDQLDMKLKRFVINLTNHVTLLPGGDVPLGAEWFSRDWPDQAYGGWPSRRYGVEAHVVFCRDAAAFFEDLAVNTDAYTAWWKGDDPLGAGLFVAGYTAEQMGNLAPMASELQAFDQTLYQVGCPADYYYDEADYPESDVDNQDGCCADENDYSENEAPARQHNRESSRSAKEVYWEYVEKAGEKGCEDAVLAHLGQDTVVEFMLERIDAEALEEFLRDNFD